MMSDRRQIGMNYGDPIVGLWFCEGCRKRYYPIPLSRLNPEWEGDQPLCPRCGTKLIYDEAE